ncbi:MAG TPA: PQQ-binding-like beta-propeller repeat protein [Candidatus Nanopelagicaceae bacterium]|nr:PQQ-binding-like beta-propeller repeat protein [Candidatus Nanopelagicaceae bacterium]
MGTELTLWRRTGTARIGVEPALLRAIPLRGVGRVPVVIGTAHIALVTYNDQAKTYDYRLLDSLGGQIWQTSLGNGGYASPVYNPDANAILVPFGLTSFAELNATTGATLWSLDLGVRVRSTPAKIPDGYLVGVANRLVRFSSGQVQETKVFPGRMLFGITSVYKNLVFGLSLGRDNEDTFTAVVAYDIDSLAQIWETRIGPAQIISCDTCGVSIVPELDQVFANGTDGSVYCLDAMTGQVRWTAPLGDGNSVETIWRSAPSVDQRYVLTGSLEGSLTCLSTSTGVVVWKTNADPLGVWSPSLILAEVAVVHSGTWLRGVNLAKGDIVWSIPIGFDGYTQPVELDGLVLISGGDPPDDGYMLWVNPRELADPIPAQVEYRMGETRDFLEINLNMTKDVKEVRLDLRLFGRSGDERFQLTPGGSFRWSGDVSADKRLAEAVVFGTIIERGQPRPFSLCIDTGVAKAPSVLSARTLGDNELPIPQATYTGSGGAVLAAVAATHGRALDPADIALAAEFMRTSIGVKPHHIWRGGAGRILAASRFPLLEMSNQVPTEIEVLEVLTRWEGAATQKENES